ncbi:cation-translocating P-type ATPase [Spirillospora sp. NPDC048911]|uniref:cation-translocating P-type ATPase n=1 Tax=Spirillospora sp. NPDC048911 TaxID=3364527 RepID=UPI003718A588
MDRPSIPSAKTDTPDLVADPREPLPLLRKELRTGPGGLSEREAARRLAVYGPNQVHRRERPSLVRELTRQLTHPLALLLWAAGVLAFVAGMAVLGWAILAVVAVNAAFALMQERQAERAVEALAAYLPERAHVIRDRRSRAVNAAEIVPGDLIVLEEGDKVPADARLTDGAVEIDLSMLTGESAPVERVAGPAEDGVALLHDPNLVFSGTTCAGGQATGIVFATGGRTELGRIAALSQRAGRRDSPLEIQVKRVAWLIAAVAVGMGMVFLAIGALVGLPLTDALTFAIGLLVANVPEGLLPTITLALAVGVRLLAREGAVIKRLSAVETLGATNVICTDKTGTLTRNRMRLHTVWIPADDITGEPDGARPSPELAQIMIDCSTVSYGEDGLQGDPTEVALVEGAGDEDLRTVPGVSGLDELLIGRDARTRAVFRFDPRLRLMSTVTEGASGLRVNVKGAPEAVLSRSVLTEDERATTMAAVERLARRGLRVLAIAIRNLDAGAMMPTGRQEAETGLRLVGLVGLFDPPRPEVPDAVRRCHDAGVRIHVVTGDNGATAAAVARQVGIGVPRLEVVAEAERLTDEHLDDLLTGDAEIVFARSSPETKLKIADALRAHGQIVAMTGDGVNDAPALHQAHIGVAMGRSGTDVAREAATMVLTDDNFATIVTAIESGRRVYDNVRKFILYIFAHAVPEIVPFLIFALSGGLVPLPLTVLQILAIDLGTETVPALALGREPAEPGLMNRPPRSSSKGVISRDMLIRAWGYLGLVSAALVMLAFFYVLWRAGWHPGDPTGPGEALHHAYLTATTATFAGLVTCQVGTALAARTDHASLRQVGLTTNRLLLGGIVFELVFTAALIYLPPFQRLFGTAALPLDVVLLIITFPVIVWGTDELRRWTRRRR